MMSITLSSVALAILFFVNRSQHANIQGDKMANINPLTSHVLDTAQGFPAKGLQITLSKMEHGGGWKKMKESATNNDGRLGDMLTPTEFTPGVYKLYFNTKGYYQKFNITTFYPYVEIVFEIVNATEHYHVPLMLSPYGYSTYRGS